MNRSLADLYETELRHLREICSEFSASHQEDGIAKQLELSKDPNNPLSRDPYVNLLLEGTAFLAARVHHKLDAEFPNFTQSLLGVIYPQYLCPTPSMAIVGFDVDYERTDLANGCMIHAETELRSRPLEGGRRPCKFRTAHPVTLWPVRLSEACYHTSRTLDQVGLPEGVRGRAVLQFRLEATAGLKFNEIGSPPGSGSTPFDRLTFHIRDDGRGYHRGPGLLASLIFEQVFAHATEVVLQFGEGKRRRNVVLRPPPIRRVGLRDDEALLPVDARTFQGYRLLREYFAFPERLLFFEVAGLDRAARECAESTMDVLIVLKEEEHQLEQTEPGTKDRPLVDANRFALYATPAINLFQHHMDPVRLSDGQSEFHVVPDGSAQSDYEVYSLSRVAACGSRPEDRQEFRPFYGTYDLDERASGFYVLFREPRARKLAGGVTGSESDYGGAEAYVSLVDATCAPYSPALRDLSIEGLCTNRDLPWNMKAGLGGTDFFPVEDGGQLPASIRCLSGPTPPIASPALGRAAWRLVSHLSLNYLTLVNTSDTEGASALRDALMLYVDGRRRELRRQVEGLRSVIAKPFLCPVPAPDPLPADWQPGFARGLEILVTFDETAFKGSSFFLLGSVLEQFFARYAGLNSFTKTTVLSSQRGPDDPVISWPARPGKRHSV